MPEEIRLYASFQSTVLADDIKDADGKVLARKGDTVVLLPQTLANCVHFPDGESLVEKWPTLSKEGHEHASTIALGEEIVRCANRVTEAECGLIGYSAALVRHSNAMTDVRIRVAELAAHMGAQRASTVSVIDGPHFSLEPLTENTGEISFSVSADALLKSGNIKKFYLTIPELAIFEREFEASENAAQISFTPYGYMANQELNVTVIAEDCYGNRSQAVTATTILVIHGIQPPVIVSPLHGEIIDSLNPDIVLEPMRVIGDLSDTAKYVRVQVAEDTEFDNLVFDNGVTAAPREDNKVPVFDGLEAGKTYFTRARWKGEFLGDSPWSKTVCFITKGEDE